MGAAPDAHPLPVERGMSPPPASFEHHGEYGEKLSGFVDTPAFEADAALNAEQGSLPFVGEDMCKADSEHHGSSADASNTDHEMMAVSDMDVDVVVFTDASGDTKFAARDGAVIYSVNGEERPQTKQLLWTTKHATGGEPGWIEMPDIGKCFDLPRDGLADILGGLKCLAGKAGVECNIGDKVRVVSLSPVDLVDSYQLWQCERIAALERGRPARVVAALEPIHGRELWDGVASAEECERAVAAAKRAMQLTPHFTDGHEGRQFPPDVPQTEPLLGKSGFALLQDLQGRVHAKIRDRYGAELTPVNFILSWITGNRQSRGGVDSNRDQHQSFDSEEHSHWLGGTYTLHVDKANQPDYDISALLYLTTAGVDFEGGHFAFNDPDCDRLVEPRVGRLLAFDSGFDNLHHVRPVLAGERLVMSIWYSRTRTTRMPLQ